MKGAKERFKDRLGPFGEGDHLVILALLEGVPAEDEGRIFQRLLDAAPSGKDAVWAVMEEWDPTPSAQKKARDYNTDMLLRALRERLAQKQRGE